MYWSAHLYLNQACGLGDKSHKTYACLKLPISVLARTDSSIE